MGIVFFNGGNLGIGTEVAESLLEVQGADATDAALTLDADDGDDNADTWIIKSQAADNDLTFTNHASELVRITDAGNLGIGVTGPAEKLEVNGKTKTTTLMVTTGAATGSVLQSDASGNATWAPVGMPSGAVTPYAGSSAPTGWLICDGSAVNRTTYAALFAIVGTTYGAGDGSTTFNLPDLRGRVPVGVGTGTYKSSGLLHSNGGSLTARTLGEYDGAEYPSGIPASSGDASTFEPSGNVPAASPSEDWLYENSGISPVKMAENTEGGNMQPYIGLNYIIKY